MNPNEKSETNIPTPEQQQLPKNPEAGFEIDTEQKFEQFVMDTLTDVEGGASEIKQEGLERLDKTSQSYSLSKEDIAAIRDENQVDANLISNSNEIDQLTQDTANQIKSIAESLPSEKIPKSTGDITQESGRDSEEKLESAETKEESAPFPEETPEEYISRFQVLITDEYIKNNPDLHNKPRLLINAYYKNYMHQALDDFNNSEEMRNQFFKTVQQLQENENVRQSPEKDDKTLKRIEKMIQASSKDSATGELSEKVEYYANTNQTREFFEKGRKYDSHSYAYMMFGLPEVFINTPQGLELLHEKVDGKSIFLFGGGESLHDLLTSEEFHPKSVTNFDPYLKSEKIDKNVNAMYRSEDISASDPAISQKIEQGDISKADEVWMTYSVPFYLDNSAEIKGLIDNIVSSLREDGNARISPVMLQNTETIEENFDTRKQTLLDSLHGLMNSGDYNVTVFNDTIKIHKIKRAPVEVENSSISTDKSLEA